ncbi:hypothetical protein [Paraclostridium sordellii]|uniref:hypothetical protein n=1 Tax=Paraclostridium sordellii TaxID=1505 RepID=UPI0005DED75C|nr:hypothetical protein [Paeniclostridium sordellii]CEN80912.1 Uncharacterised protein [[Clostridium] sordellii] [Paeniclostridium sordellii]
MERDEYTKIFKTLESMMNEYDGFKSVMTKILKRSISKKNLKRVIYIVVFCLLFLKAFVYVVKSDNTYKYVKELISITDSTMIALLGITFTGYALFQALASGYTLRVMLKNRENGISKFEEFNLSFFSLTIGFLLVISINYILRLIIPIIIDSNILTNIPTSVDTKNLIFIILIFIYVVFNIYLLLEMRSFIFNIFQCFNLNAVAQGMKVLKENQSEKHDK